MLSALQPPLVKHAIPLPNTVLCRKISTFQPSNTWGSQAALSEATSDDRRYQTQSVGAIQKTISSSIKTTT